MLQEVLTALGSTPHDWSTTNFIIKYRDIFSTTDNALKALSTPIGIIEKYEDDQCAAGITYLLGLSFTRYHTGAKDVP